MMLASRFSRTAHSVYSHNPLTDEEIRKVAPSIFADMPHGSRSERYAYIPTSVVLAKLRTEGFEPFMATQTRVRDEGRRDFTKHMVRLRHRSLTADSEAGEVILLNSHDGSSSYQMLAGMFRFVCSNGLIVGDVVEDIRIPHKGDVVDGVIQGAFDVLDGLDLVREVRDEMSGLRLDAGEQQAFAKAALQLRYEPSDAKPAPISESQLLMPRRAADTRADLWTTFNVVQENIVRGDLAARTATNRRTRTRPVQGIDQGVKINRALWVLAEEMKKLKA
ncbi:DUF945 domain-containing protein [Paracidovorax citrulli]